MGELIEVGSGMSGGMGVAGAIASLAALGLYALLSGRGNDDDDSSPGGGLMQPVA